VKVTVFTAKGEKKEDREVKSQLFDVAVNPDVIHEVVVAQMNNRRSASAKAKRRGEVAGGGKKPHKQKGTGRARSGSIRNPLWKGGGVIFGPTGIQNFVQNISKKKRRSAIISALAAKKDIFIIIEDLKAEKTKDFAKVINKVVENGKSLVVFEGLREKDLLAGRNLSDVKIIDYRNINVYDVLNADKMLFVGNSLQALNEFLGVK
jgi:large subunit ribosomal protein L4